MKSLIKNFGMSSDSFKMYLQDQYEDKSQIQIARNINCSVDCIERNFSKLGIRTLNRSESGNRRWKKSVSLSKEQLDVVIGLLLSDFHISKEHTQARITFGFKYDSFAQSIIDCLLPLEFHKLYLDKKTNCFHSKSKSCNIVTDLYCKWYDKKRKIVPKDILLNGEILYWWYLGDGKVSNYSVTLCTDSYSIQEVNMLRKKLLKQLGIKTTRLESTNRIRIRSSSVDIFMQIIGPCRHECYRYKWNLKLKRRNFKCLKK